MLLAKHTAIVAGLTLIGFMVPVYPTWRQAGFDVALNQYQNEEFDSDRIQNVFLAEGKQVLTQSQQMMTEIKATAPEQWPAVTAAQLGGLLRSDGSLVSQAMRWSIMLGGSYFILQTSLWLFGRMLQRGLISNLLLLGGAGAFLTQYHFSAGLMALAIGAVLKFGQAVDQWTGETEKNLRYS